MHYREKFLGYDIIISRLKNMERNGGKSYGSFETSVENAAV